MNEVKRGRPHVKEVRKQRQVRATDKEWEAYRKFGVMIKHMDGDRINQLIEGFFEAGPVPTAPRETSPINDVFTLSEASEKWGVSTSAITQSCLGQKGNPPRFQPYEARKSARTWLVTYDGMCRLYGNPIK